MLKTNFSKPRKKYSTLNQAASALLDGASIPPLMYPERVFLSSQISKSTMEPLQKLWTGQDSIIAIICQSKVIRSFRLRGNITPSSIRVLIGMYKSLETACVLFIPTQHGKRMFLAERVEGTGVGDNVHKVTKDFLYLMSFILRIC